MENTYLILKNLSGTYCNTIHNVSNNLEQATKLCKYLNMNSKNGITYEVRKASDFSI